MTDGNMLQIFPLRITEKRDSPIMFVDVAGLENVVMQPLDPGTLWEPPVWLM